MKPPENFAAIVSTLFLILRSIHRQWPELFASHLPVWRVNHD
jgi:hypothetical protein